MIDQQERAQLHNAKLRRTMAAAREARGFTVVRGGHGERLHAAVSTVRGYEGFVFARPLCQASTSRFFYDPTTDQTVAVTCKRCLASLQKRQVQA